MTIVAIAKIGVEWDGYDNKGLPVGTGIYFYHLAVTGKFSSTKKMILLK